MAYCTGCGSQMPDGARFCTSCGRTAVGDRAGAASPAPPPAHGAPPAAHPAPPPAHHGPAAASPPAHAGPSPAPSTSPHPASGRPDWKAPARIAGAALGIGVALQYALGGIMVLIQWLAGIGVDWGATLRAPLTVFLAMHGPVEGLGLWATGVGWIVLAFWLAVRRAAPDLARPGSAGAALWLITQSALLYTAAVLALALLLQPEALPVILTGGGGAGIAGSFFDPAAYPGWNGWAVIPLGFAVSAAAAAVALAGGTWAAALRRRLPAEVVAGWAGAKAAARVGVPGVLLLVIGGVVVEAIAEGIGLQFTAAYLLTVLLAAAAWGGIDVAAAFWVFSMRFFAGDEFVVLGERPTWVLAGIGVVAAATLWGGSRAASARGVASAARVAVAAAVAGVIVAAGLLAAALLSTGTAPDLAGPAFGLGLLWTAATVLGGLWEAGFRPGRGTSAAPSPPPAAPPH